MKNNEQIVLAALKQNTSAAKHAGKILKQNILAMESAIVDKCRLSGITRKNILADKEFALDLVKLCGGAIDVISPKLKNDFSFLWKVSGIQSQQFDKYRKEYVDAFFGMEGLKLFLSLDFGILGALLITGSIALPIPALATLILGSVIVSMSGLYAASKGYQYAHNFFKQSETSEVDTSSKLTLVP